MIVSFTGAQSTGKTTLLNKVKELNTNFNYVDEVTRRINREFNLPINEDGSDVTQLMIMADHISNVYRRYGHDVTVLDRCALDGVVYTQWLYNQGKVSKSTLSHAISVFDRIMSMVDVIFYTNHSDVELVDDGERSTCNSFREEILSLFEMYKNRMSDHVYLNNLYTVSGTVDERMTFIKKVLEDRGVHIKIK